eukprot:727026-Amphidinium_carterae.1
MATELQVGTFAVLTRSVGARRWQAEAHTQAVGHNGVGQGGGWRGWPRREPASRERLSNIPNERIVLEQRPAKSVGTISKRAVELSNQVFVEGGCETVLQAADGPAIMCWAKVCKNSGRGNWKHGRKNIQQVADLSGGPLGVGTARQASGVSIVEAGCVRNGMDVAKRGETQATQLGREHGYAPLQRGQCRLLRELSQRACLGAVHTLNVGLQHCERVGTHEVHELGSSIAAECLERNLNCRGAGWKQERELAALVKALLDTRGNAAEEAVHKLVTKGAAPSVSSDALCGHGTVRGGPGGSWRATAEGGPARVATP